MKRKNSKKKKVIIAGVIAAVVVLGVAVWFLAIRPRRGTVMAKGTAEAMSTEVSSGSISTTVVGTGTLQNDEENAVQIPAGLTVDEVLVESGDIVKVGDVLATVNYASVLKELSSVQEELADLDEEINDTKGDKESAYINTYISGRVKKIYAKEGDSVASVMKEQGALLVLSIDDKMAVTLEEVSGVSVGDEVTVTLSDGTEEDGDVESVSGSTCIVTLTDDGTEIGDTVKVTDADGKEIGSGALYVHQPIEITGTVGTVSDIDVEENEEVSASETLFELEDLPDSAEYQQLLAERADLAERLKMLTELAVDNTIKAEYDGTVQSVNVTAEKSGTGSSSGNNTAAGNTMASASEVTFVQTAAGTLENVFQFASTAGNTEVPKVTSITDMEALFEELSASVAVPVTAAVPVSEIKETEQYTGKITWSPADAEFAEKTGYTAVMELTAKEGYQFVIADGTELSYPGAQGTLWEIQEQCEQNTLKLTVVFPETAEKETEQPKESETQETEAEKQPQSETQGGQGAAQTPQTDAQPSDNTPSGTNSTQKNDTDTGNSGNTAQAPSESQKGTTGSSAGQGGSTGQTGMASGGASGGSLSGVSTGSGSQASASNTSSTSSAEDTADTGMETAFTISKNENMLLSVNIDELDILSIQEGQEVTVTLDALEGQKFEGELSKINRTASNSGGVTKYTAEVTIPKEESMLAGMNATATIIVESKENILTLPADAVQEHGNKSFVYTEKGEDGTLSGEIEVETGISDGTKVEIISGLEEGQTVYYNVAVSEESSQQGFGNMMMGGMMNGGERPAGSGKGSYEGGGRGTGGNPGGNAPSGQ